MNGPAVESTNGYEAWFSFGQLHRIDGPAITWADYSAAWYQHGQLHRIEGPAIDDINGNSQWHIDGRRLTREKHDEYREQLGVARAEELCEFLDRLDLEKRRSSTQNQETAGNTN